MSEKMTTSQAKLEVYRIARERDRKAKEIMERTGLSFSEAYLMVSNDSVPASG